MRDSNKSRGGEGDIFLTVDSSWKRWPRRVTERETERFKDEGYRMTLILRVDLPVDTLARNNSFDDSLQKVW